ncbi:MAG: hypothetical protein JWM80_4785, partial [Cyanobacteria bacterium RYN_339]|nr:hypothetical protein [Cyanobacteria bacterium RYN_339]
MSDPRISAQPAAPLTALPRAVVAARSGSGMKGDSLTLAARPTFSWQRAGGHFWHGMGHQFKQMLLAPCQHPLATLAV